MTEFICNTCNTIYPIDAIRYKCDCGDPLNLKKPQIRFPLDEIAKRSNTLWRYREAIPISDDASIVSLGEGMTPLVPFDDSEYEHHLMNIFQLTKQLHLK